MQIIFVIFCIILYHPLLIFRLVAKNAVEEYIYSIREKICEELEPYILEAEREAYSRKLTETEDWLYEDGEFADKKTYT